MLITLASVKDPVLLFDFASSPAILMSSQEELETLTILNHYQITTYFSAACTIILVYDYFLTFTREVNLVWPSRWTHMKVLFLLARYLPFVDLGYRTWINNQVNPDIHTCQIAYTVVSGLFFVGVAVCEIMLTLRAWAVWGQDWRLSIGLPIFFVICWGPCIFIIINFTNSLAFTTYSIPSLTGCLPIRGSHIVFYCWLAVLIYETGMFLLMLIAGIKCYNGIGPSRVFRVVFRDGLIYYSYLFAVSTANVIVVAYLTPDMQLLLAGTERYVHPVFACRVLLDIREIANRDHLGSYESSYIPNSQTTALKYGRSTIENENTVE